MRKPEHTLVPRYKVRYTATHSCDMACTVATGRAWITGVLAQHVQYVAEVQPDCTNTKGYLCRCQSYMLSSDMCLYREVSDRATCVQTETECPR